MSGSGIPRRHGTHGLAGWELCKYLRYSGVMSPCQRLILARWRGARWSGVRCWCRAVWRWRPGSQGLVGGVKGWMCLAEKVFQASRDDIPLLLSSPALWNVLSYISMSGSSPRPGQAGPACNLPRAAGWRYQHPTSITSTSLPLTTGLLLGTGTSVLK